MDEPTTIDPHVLNRLELVQALRRPDDQDGTAERLADILVRRFGSRPETLQAIGVSYGLGRERVRQLQQHALRRLRSRHSVLYEAIITRQDPNQ